MPDANPRPGSAVQRLASASFGAFAALGASLGFSAAVLAGMTVAPQVPAQDTATGTRAVASAAVGVSLQRPGPDAVSQRSPNADGKTPGPRNERSQNERPGDDVVSAAPQNTHATATDRDAPLPDPPASDDAATDALEEPPVTDAPSPDATDRGRGDGTAPAARPASATDRSAEANMGPTELYNAAKTAYDDGDSREAYRLATRSYRARKSDRTQGLRGKAACKTKNRDAAKSIVKSFKLRDPQRKSLRTFCKKQGVSVGL